LTPTQTQLGNRADPAGSSVVLERHFPHLFRTLRESYQDIEATLDHHGLDRCGIDVTRFRSARLRPIIFAFRNKVDDEKSLRDHVDLYGTIRDCG
jgi:hypothetical protein